MDWVLLADSTAPATGQQGAAAVFGPQKGASPDDVAVLDRGLAALCDVAGIDPNTPGMGAAGGAAIGITWLSTLLHGDDTHVHLVLGSRVVAESNGLAELVADAALVITGEGRFDAQTATGKVASTVFNLVEEHNPDAVIAVAAGAFEQEATQVAGRDIIAVPLTDVADAADTEEQLTRAGAQIAVAYLSTSTVQG